MQLEVRPLESHGYCVVNLGDTYAVPTASSASSFSFVFAFSLVSTLKHLPTHILCFFFSYSVAFQSPQNVKELICIGKQTTSDKLLFYNGSSMINCMGNEEETQYLMLYCLQDSKD